MLGDLLRETRERKNLSLDDVEKGTNIRKLYIKSIEEGNYEKLPGEVFLKGFIKTYGKFLGLDGQTLIEQYKAEKNPNVNQNIEDTIAKIDEKPVTPPPETIQKPKPDKPFPKKNVPKINELETNDQYLKTSHANNKKNILLIILILAIIIGGAIFFLSSQQASTTTTPTPTVKQEQTSAPNSNPTPAPVPEPIKGSEVVAKFSQDCWVEVNVDGNIILSETVKAGSNLTWKGTKQIDITAGNAGAVEISFNGQPAEKLGELGAVVTKSYISPDTQTTANNQNQQPNNK